MTGWDMEKKISLVASIALACLLCARAECDEPARGYDSPQAAFDAKAAAYRTREWGTVYDALTPESQQERVAMQLAQYRLAQNQLATLKELSQRLNDDRLPELMAETQANLKKLSKLLNDHNVPVEKLPAKIDVLAEDWPETYPRVASLVPDQRAFFTEYLDRHRTFAARHKPSPKDRQLRNVEIEGDVARGEVIGGLQLFGPEPIEFRRIRGRWFVHTADLTRQQIMSNVPKPATD